MNDEKQERASTRKQKRLSRRRAVKVAIVLAIVAIAAAIFFGIQPRLDPDELMAQAKQQFDAGDYPTAIINLKNIIGRDKTNRDARFLLGQVYIKAGNPAGAVKEFLRARNLGVAAPELNLGIVRAMIISGKFDEAATEIAIYGDTTQPEWLVLRGMLDLSQQRLDDARAAFSKVLVEFPDNEQARRGLMRAELAAGNAELARAEIERLLALKSADANLWLIKGELDLYDNNAEDARKSYQQSVNLAPDNPLAHLGMGRALLRLNELDLATNHLDEIGTSSDADPRVNFLRARIAEDKGDYNSALQRLRQVLQVAPMHRESLVVAAKILFTQGEFTRAQDYVSRLLEIEPQNAAARRMLGAIQLAAGRMDGLDGIGDSPAAHESLQDPGMLALLGTAYLKHGKFEDSRNSLERAAELAPDSLPIRTQLALSRLSAGQHDEAVGELEAILEIDPDFVQADIMLALAHIARRDKDAAVATTRNLIAKHPESALAHNVQGYVFELDGDKDEAARAYEVSLVHDESFHPARINLARLAIQSGDRDTATRRFKEVLDIEPFQPFALTGLAALALQDDDLDEAEKLWQLAREHNPDAVAPRLLLAKHFRAKKNMALAETAINEAYRLAPFAVQIQAEYASIMLQIGSFEESLRAARALNARAPDSLQGLELLANIYNQLGDERGLTQTLERIAEVAPDAVGAQVLLGRLAIRRKDYDEANVIIGSLMLNEENASVGYELKGDMELGREQNEAGYEAYTRAHEIAPNSSNVLKLDAAERSLGRATDRLSKWLSEHPDDLQVRLVHASYLQQKGSGSDAIPEYEQMLKAQGKNPVVLNNLAWLYHEAEDKRALDLARRAHELAPQRPEILDTYGWILFSQGQHEQGLGFLKKASEIAPDNPDIAYHVASALSASGQSGAARKTLLAILSTHKKFSMRKQAESLLAKISNE